MKTLIIIINIVLISFTAKGQKNVEKVESLPIQVVEASCGQCNFGLTSKKGCDLAVKIDGKAYWVDGTDIHSHGDAHGDGGFCTTVRKAEIAGKIGDDGRFKATHFVLLPKKSKQKGHEGHSHN